MLLIRRLIRVSDFLVVIGTAAHATLEMELPLSHMRTGIVDTIASLQGFDGKVNPVSKVHNLCMRIDDIWIR